MVEWFLLDYSIIKELFPTLKLVSILRHKSWVLCENSVSSQYFQPIILASIDCLNQLSGCAVLYLVAQSCPTLCDPMGTARQALLSMGTLQARILEWVAMPPRGIFPTQGSNPGLPHCRQILYHLNHLNTGHKTVIF